MPAGSAAGVGIWPNEDRQSDYGRCCGDLEKRKRASRAHGYCERAVLSAAYEFGLRNGYATSNPCRGVRRNKEKPRKRYVTTPELQAALDKAPMQFQELLAAAYYTGLRQADLLALRISDLRKDGIYVTESKTGRARIIEWSPELRKLIDGAKDQSAALAEKLGHTAPLHVFTGRYGAPWTQCAVQSQMRASMSIGTSMTYAPRPRRTLSMRFLGSTQRSAPTCAGNAQNP